ncbi:MAG: iron-containing alcohol dehydrogenase [Rubrobacteraceae bacterium]
MIGANSEFGKKRADPTDLVGLREGLVGSDPEGLLSPLGLKRIEIGSNILDLLPECVANLTEGTRENPRILLVADATRITRSGEDLKKLVEEILFERYDRVERVVIGAHHAQLHADEEALAEAEAAVADADCVVVVGSGTITDICKVAVHRTGGGSLVVVQTAASVDGFSDDVSVVLKSGVKRTIPSRWPDVLLSDLPTISEAPFSMTAAGYGDAISMYTAPADWRLASLVGLDDSHHPAPVAMLLEGGPDVLGAAEGVGRLESESMEKLVRLLALRGIASGVSGSTAILSGAEHLMSHMLDMHAGQTGTPPGVHGAQVGVATVIAAAAWQTLLENLDPSKIDVDTCFPEPENIEPIVREAFSGLDPTGAVGDECWRDYEQKLSRWRDNRKAFESFLENWPRHRAELEELVAAPERLAEALTLVGAPAKFEDLSPPISPETSRWALRNCHFMRNRFNVVDLLYFLGWWDDVFIERVSELACQHFSQSASQQKQKADRLTSERSEAG